MLSPPENKIPTATSYMDSSFKCDTSMDRDSNQSLKESPYSQFRDQYIHLPNSPKPKKHPKLSNLPLAGKITKIISLPVSERRKEEVDMLINYFKNVSFFKGKFDFQSKVFKDAINAVTTKRFDNEEIVFKFGEEGQGFYVVLEGTVSVQVPNPVIE